MNDVVRPKILLVDDEQSILDSLYRFCRQRKWDAVRANSGAEGLEVLESETVDVIISDMRMPNMDGAEFLKKSRDKAPNAIRILLTGYADMEAVISAVNEAKIYNYLNKPWDENMLESVINSALDFKGKEDERLRLAKEIEEKNIELESLNHSLEEKITERTADLQKAMQEAQESSKKVNKNFRESLALMTSIVEMQNGCKANFCNMIANASVAIAKAMELSPKEIEQIRIASLLHNIGKLSLPEALRKKAMSEMSRAELDVFTKHPIQAEVVLSGMTGLKTVAKIIRSHQEYINGKGFPDRLIINKIPIGAQILCVTTDFQKLENNLLVKDVSGPEQAVEHIKAFAGKHYDVRIVELFVKYYEEHLQDYRSHMSMLPVDEVQEGMILAENLMSANGLLLLTRDTVLTEDHISHLKNYESDIGGKLIFPILNASIDQLNGDNNELAANG